MSQNNMSGSQRPMGGRRGGPMGGMGRPVEKAKNFKVSLKRLIGYLKPHRVNLAIVLIFAILSTTFTIAAPKVTSRAMNKLQDGYMAGKMLTEMAKGQDKAVNQIYDKMGEAQQKAIDQIDENMIKGQNEAVDKITSQMADAQRKAVDQILNSTATQMYSGVVDGQKMAVAQITKQMAAAQKGLLAQMQQQATQPGQTPAQPPSPEVMQAMQALAKLPVIDTIADPQARTNTVIAFIDILQKLPPMPTAPGSQQMDPRALEGIKQLLQLPMLETIKDPNVKIDTVKRFIALSGSLPGSGTQKPSSLQFDRATMDKIYARIPYVQYTKPTTNTGVKMNQSALNAVSDLLRFPMIDTIQNPQQRLDSTIKLLDIFKRMPQTGTAQNTDAKAQLDPAALTTVQELLKLPRLDTITDPNLKAETISRMVDLFNQMPDMGNTDNNQTDTTMSPETLKAVQDLEKLPLLNSITDPQQKTVVLQQLLDVFSRMPDVKSENANDANQNDNAKFDPTSIQSIKDFIALPRLATLTDANQRADVVNQIMDLGKKMKFDEKTAPESPEKEIKLTDEQINGVIRAIRETNGKIDFNYIGYIAMILIAMYLISAVFSLTMGLVMSGVSQKTVRDLRREVDAKLAKLPLKYFDMHPHGDILSRVTNDVDTIATTLQQSLTQIITSVVSIIGYIIMMLTISKVLTLIVLATLPLYVLVTANIAKKSQKFFAAQQKELGQLSGHVEEMYTGHKIVKAFGRETDSIKKFEDVNDRLYNAGWKAQFVSGIMFPLMNFISNLGYVLISIVGGIWITRNLLKLGDILAFIQYSRSFTMPIVQTANIANIIQSTVACAERVFEVLDEQEELPDKPEAKTLEAPRGDVTIEHVDFRYKEEVPLIEDMNLDVKKGSTIAIVGPTGAGKTTLVNLLMRFYEINAGKIKIDGVDIRDLKRSELRQLFGMVLQDTWLFKGTIRDNIAYGRQDATEEEVIRAAKAAHADHFIRTLPEGYDTVLNEEATNISQGQKQLLTIARAILADPTILILDEATSSVDTRTEVLIQKAMSNLMQNRTSFVIAHRLSTIREAEMILVMNHGRIIEQGNHKELLAKGGFYADLYNSQFAGNTEEAV